MNAVGRLIKMSKDLADIAEETAQLKRPEPLKLGEEVKICCGAKLRLRPAEYNGPSQLSEIIFDASHCGGGVHGKDNIGSYWPLKEVRIMFYHNSLPEVIAFLKRAAATLEIEVD